VKSLIGARLDGRGSEQLVLVSRTVGGRDLLIKRERTARHVVMFPQDATNVDLSRVLERLPHAGALVEKGLQE